MPLQKFKVGVQRASLYETEQQIKFLDALMSVKQHRDQRMHDGQPTHVEPSLKFKNKRLSLPPLQTQPILFERNIFKKNGIEIVPKHSLGTSPSRALMNQDRSAEVSLEKLLRSPSNRSFTEVGDYYLYPTMD